MRPCSRQRRASSNRCRQQPTCSRWWPHSNGRRAGRQQLLRWPTPLLVLLLLAAVQLGSCLAQPAAAEAAPRVLFGQLQVILVHDKENSGTPMTPGQQPHQHEKQQQGSSLSAAAAGDSMHVQHFLLRQRSGRTLRLQFPSARHHHMPRSGASVMVRVLDASRCAGAAPRVAPSSSSSSSSSEALADADGHVCVGSMLAQEAGPRDVFASSQPRGAYKFRALVMLLQVCGQGAATTPDALSGALFDGLPNSQAETLQGAFAACSYGNADFSRGDVEVVPMVVPIPCQGTTPWGLPYDSKTCPYVEWSDVANQYVRDAGIDWAAFKHKAYVVPPGGLCSWGGMGYVGCTSDCRAWISGDLWQYPTTWLHELGHNLFMNHAGSYQDGGSGGPPAFVNYKDDSGAMGHCCSTRCFNAPHSYQVGWSKPLDVLHKGSLAPGVWQSYLLPPRQGAGSSATNMLRVQADWNGPSAAYNIFLEYRAGQGYDAGLLDGVRNRVTVYSTLIGDAMPFTTLEASVGGGQILHESRLGSGLAIWVGAKAAGAGGGIRVHVCRPDPGAAGQAEADCGDGRDNDCNGYTDEEDAACKAGPSRRLQLAAGGNGTALAGLAIGGW